MKKVFVSVLVLAALAVPAFAAGPTGLTGFGLYGNVGATNGTLGGGVGVSLKWASFPVIGIQYDFTVERFGTSVDYYVVDAEAIGSLLSYFLGVGVYAGVANDAFDFGFRIPVGLQFWPIRKLELFVSPVLSVALIRETGPGLGFGAEFGGRVHF